MFLSFQAAHSDIESHGQLIKSVVELCDKHIRRNYKQRTQSSKFTTFYDCLLTFISECGVLMLLPRVLWLML